MNGTLGVSRARLTALRLVGFKSFAERTTVEFGPGISAVVGPNGSGKSNLADALRWTLGEQGRSLRTRRSEDLIFAGSSARRALGMADVTLVIDNHDRLLPVDYGEVEIGRRLYRSGENEYLLNRQRIRLRDLVEMLDAGNLADNAFLFIGQGMVDQALALRPEERRPLFEEAAGVRRHERRRRQAEAELAEAETNLERLRDLLAELRPQARRLAAQAEQLQARQTAGIELAEALLAAARARWAALWEASAREQGELDRAHAAADGALAELKAAEEEAAGLSSRIGRRAEAEREQRGDLDRQREQLTQLRVESARLESELSALERDRQRVDSERAAAEGRRSESLNELGRPPRAMDAALTRELEVVERQLAEIEGAARAAPSDPAALLAARRDEFSSERQRLDPLRRSIAETEARLQDIDDRLAVAETERDRAAQEAASAVTTVHSASAALLDARAEWEAAAAARAAAHEALSASETEAAAVRARLASLEASLASFDDGLARAARARGGRRLAEGLEVDPSLRTAVSAALGSAAAGFVVPEDSILHFAARRGTLVQAFQPSGRARGAAAAAAIAALVEAASVRGGGRLADAIRRDPQAQVSRLLARVVWLPDLAAALEVRPKLADGWLAVTLAGELVDDRGVIELAAADSMLDRQNERDRLARDLVDLEARLAGERQAFDARASRVERAAAAMAAAQQEHESSRAAVRRSEEAERLAVRRAEQLSRESEWERARLDGMQRDLDAAQALLDRLSSEVESLERQRAGGVSGAGAGAAMEAGIAELRTQRDELSRRVADQEAGVRAAEEARRRAEISLALDAARLRELDAETQRLTGREVDLAARRTQLDAALAAAEKSETEAAAHLEQTSAAGADERAGLMAAEQRAGRCREVLRDAETRSRAAEVRAMEARLHLEQTREQLLVELAGIGADGLITLRGAAGLDTTAEAGEPATDQQADAEVMEAELSQLMERWQAEPPSEAPPSPNRLAALRRRFHELGAGNPFAAQEYAELRERLEALEAQHADMEAAIVATRDLIASLNAMIHDQFRSTFAALEGAFSRRFEELFGGGDAQLSLTAPDDLTVTGVEIYARPPGKRRQPLSMLSGGERALTAVSLLMAMLEVRPVPFCVLDEVDAALDEANIGRFSRALRGLAEHIQFIVITHNRGTIEAADSLYGVTIGDDAVSRVVSLRLPGTSGNGDARGDRLAEMAAS